MTSITSRITSSRLMFYMIVVCAMLACCKREDADMPVTTEPPDNGVVSESAGAQRPFPQHVNYADGIILPNHKTQSELDEDLKRVYNTWRDHYLTEDIGVKGQYYIKYQPGGPVTVSEAHGYGMLAFVYMAGHDPDAKKYFDGMFYFFKAHPSPGNKGLMDWQQEIKNGKVVSIGGSSATDGDMDIAYALLLADKQWGSTGKINYKTEALAVIAALKQSVVHKKMLTLKLGDWATGEGTRLGDATRPSDFMLQHLKTFYKVSGDVTWKLAADNTYNVINDIFKNNGASTGLMPDFAEFKNGKFIPAEGKLLEAYTDGAYSYNAARTPWRIATDRIVEGDMRADAQLAKLNTWIRLRTHENPDKICSGYYLDGVLYPGRDYQDLTFQSPFMVSAMIGSENQQWLNKLWDNGTSRSNSYFGDSITLLSLIVASGNWWAP